MVFRILCNSDSRVVINKEMRRGSDGEAKFTEKVAHADDLFSSFNCSNILCFCG
jgi:hypothetical protein